MNKGKLKRAIYLGNKILEKKDIMISQSKKSNNLVVKILLKVEEKYFTKISLPFGIRCFICAKKPNFS